jgi:uncharacterized OB-fold protein
MTFQPLPEVTDDTAAFWEGGADGSLHIHRCRACRAWFHPPAPVCPECLSMDVTPEATSGRGTVKGFSVNVQPWAPDMEVPYVVGIVSIDDAPGVQITTRFVEVDPAAVTVGMPVEVTFLHVDDIHLPLFRPASARAEEVAS